MSYNERVVIPSLSINTEPYDIVEHENTTTYNNNRYGVKGASTALSALPGAASSLTAIQLLPQFVIKRPIYTDEYNNRLSNAYLFDDVISVALDKLSYFTLGASDEIRGVLYPESVRPLKSEFEAKNALKELKIVKNALNISSSIVSSVLSDQEIDQFEKYVHYTDKIAKLGSFIRKNHKAAHVFARSASYIEYSDEGIPDLYIKPGSPIGLKPLKSQFLGNVVLDKETWVMRALEYRDPTLKFKEYVDFGIKAQQQREYEMQAGLAGENNQQVRYLDADNVLYFVKNNNNMMRDDDDFWFGHSTLQSILPLSEENRRLNSIVIPAINQGHWAGTGIWSFPNYTETQIRDFFSRIKPGGHIGVGNDQIKFQQTNLSYDYVGILNLKNELKRQMMSAFSIPSFLMNFENVTNRACYSEDTETLTENGWKYYWDIDETKDKIATFNPKTEELEFHLPIKKFVYDNKDGEMINFYSQTQDILVTPEHVMWCKSGDKIKKWNKRQAKELIGLSRIHVRSHIKPSIQSSSVIEYIVIPTLEYSNMCAPCNRTIQQEQINLNLYLEFLGYYLSEGTRTYIDNGIYHVALSQNIECNKTKSDKIQSCLDSLGFKFGSYIDSNNIKRWQIDNKQLHNLLSLETGGNHLTKKIPRWIFTQCNNEQLKILFDALVLGDGTIDTRLNRTNKTYYTTSKQLADDVQELALRLGLYARVKIYDDKRPLKSKSSYRSRIYKVMIHETDGHVIHQIKKVKYVGEKVYCFEVPNHLFITRRNGKIAIQGNTAETVLIGFNESTIQAERSWISDILDDQWYPKLFKSYWPDDENIHIKMKINLEFSNIAFESFLEKAVAIVALMEKGLITMTEARNILKLPPLLPQDYAELGLKPPVDLMGAQQFEIAATAPNLVAQLGQMNANKQQQQGPPGQQQQGNNTTVSNTDLQNMASKAGVAVPTLSSIKQQLLNG